MNVPASVTRRLREQCGLEEGVCAASSLAAVTRQRMEATGRFEPDDYFELLERSAEEFEAFADCLLVPESWFFRDRKPFEWLAQWARQTWLPAHSGQVLRVLSVPCAFGQEPYSIAITLLQAGFAPEAFTVLAGDLSPRCLAEAEAGVYRPIAFRGGLPEGADAYFEPMENGNRRVRDEARTSTQFQRLNLLEPSFPGAEPPFHVVFCRNVLIYFSPEARAHAAANLDRALGPEGLLFSGHADAWGLLAPDYGPSGPSGAFCFQRRTVPVARPPTPASRAPWRPAHPARPRLPIPVPATETVVVPGDAVRALADAGQLEKAEARAREALREHPADAESHALLGEILVARGHHREAELLFRRAVYLDAQHADALLHLALLSERRGDLRAAERLRRRARAAQKTEVRP